MKSSTKPATTFMEGIYFDEGKEYPFELNSAEIYYIFNAICSYDLDNEDEKGVDHFPKLYDLFYANHLNKLGEEVL
mgnify:FL=1|tara:strand:- start:297 stop:524 length:228 start_codon:yes stop_codon:yes gene_type:complete